MHAPTSRWESAELQSRGRALEPECPGSNPVGCAILQTFPNSSLWHVLIYQVWTVIIATTGECHEDCVNEHTREACWHEHREECVHWTPVPAVVSDPWPVQMSWQEGVHCAISPHSVGLRYALSSTHVHVHTCTRVHTLIHIHPQGQSLDCDSAFLVAQLLLTTSSCISASRTQISEHSLKALHESRRPCIRKQACLSLVTNLPGKCSLWASVLSFLKWDAAHFIGL